MVFAFNGLTLNLLMWPSHMATFSWMPWVVLAVELAWREGGRKIILAAIAGALQMLAGGPEIIFLTWLFLLALWLQQFVATASRPALAMFWRFPLRRGAGHCADRSATAAVPRPRRALATRHRLRGLALVHARLGLGEFSRADGVWRARPTEGVFFQYGQNWTSSYYLGIGTLWLALLALLGVRDRRVRLLGAAAAVGADFCAWRKHAGLSARCES